MRGRDRRSWESRPNHARIVRLLAFAIPIIAAVAATLAVASALPRPGSPGATVLWWLVVLAAGAIASRACTRLVTRVLPLAVLFDLTLTFPDVAPSRYRVAREAWSVKRSQAALEGLDETTPAQRSAEAALAFIAALDAHDRGTRGHSERVRLLTELVARELSVPPDDIERLRWAALLHDLGKLNVHPEVLNKDGRPTEQEWKQLLAHPEEGAALARPLRSWLGPWALAVAEHHERYDGGGYPHGLQGEEISLAGRIVAVADSYEAMTSHRSYNTPRSGVDARRELVAGAGTQFDPSVVHAFLRVSLPRRLRGSVPIAWLLSLPLLGWLRRLPAQSTAVTVGSGAAAVAVMAAGLLPGTAVVPAEPPAAAEPESSESTSPEPEPAPAPSNSAQDEPDDSRPVAVRPPQDDAETRGSGGGSGGDAAPSDAPRSPTPESPPDDVPEDPSTEPEPSPDEQAPVNTSLVTNTLYLLPREQGDTDWRHELDLGTEEPTGSELANYDRDRDDVPGLTLRPGGASPRWVRSYETPTVVAGNVEVVVHVRANAAVSGTLRAVLDACRPDLSQCRRIASGSVTGADWSAEDGWAERRIDMAVASEVLLEPSVLALSLVAETNGDLLLAFGTAGQPSRLEGLVVEPLTLVAAPASATEATNAALHLRPKRRTRRWSFAARGRGHGGR